MVHTEGGKMVVQKPAAAVASTIAVPAVQKPAAPVASTVAVPASSIAEDEEMYESDYDGVAYDAEALERIRLVAQAGDNNALALCLAAGNDGKRQRRG